MSNSLVVSADGAESVTISLGGEVTAEDLQASIDAAIGPGRVVVGRSSPVRPEPPPSYIYPSRPPFRMTGPATEDSPRARPYHAPGCRWEPSSRRWTCVDACPVPDMIEEEAADDD